MSREQWRRLAPTVILLGLLIIASGFVHAIIPV